jgi:hypothetical protein
MADDLVERVGTVEAKVDSLAASMEQRFDDFGALMDRRFDEFGTLMDRRFEEFGASVDRRFEDVAEAFAEQRRYTDFAYEQLNGTIVQLHGKVTLLDEQMTGLSATVNSGFSRLERKLDQLIDRA